MRKLFLLLTVLYSTVALSNESMVKSSHLSIFEWLFGESNAKQKNDDKELEDRLCNKPCSSFALYDTSGKLWTEQTIKGKVSVIVIWHVYCKPCLKEIPQMNELVKRYNEVNFLAMTFNTEQQVKNTLESKPCQVVHLTNALSFISNAGIVATPTKLLIDKRGIVRYIIRGGEEKQHKLLEKKIKELSKE